MDKGYVINVKNNFLVLSFSANEDNDDIVMEFNMIDYKQVYNLIEKWNNIRDTKYLNHLFKYKI